MRAHQAAPPEPVRKRYRLRPSGCCDLPRVVRLTDAEAAPGLASGMLQPLPDEPTTDPQEPRSHP